jgi:hypothetical protein
MILTREQLGESKKKRKAVDDYGGEKALPGTHQKRPGIARPIGKIAANTRDGR